MDFYQIAMIGGVTWAVALSWVVLIPFLIMYLLGEADGRKTGKRDPMLGPRVLLTMLMTVGGQLLLAGLAMIAVYAVEDVGKDVLKTGFGFVVAGALVSVYPFSVYYVRVGTEGPSRVTRQALGFNAILTGMAFSLSGLLTSVLAFHDEDIAGPGALCLIYLAATVMLVSRLLQNPLPPAHARTTGNSGGDSG